MTSILSRQITFSMSRIFPWAIVWLSLPLGIFFLSWIKPQYGIPLTAVGVLCVYFTIRQPSSKTSLTDQTNDQVSIFGIASREVRISYGLLIALICIAIIWCLLGGIGGLWFQNSDLHARNALFRDLINNPWPVYYDNGTTALTYYIGFWLPEALAAKCVLLVTGNMQVAWIFGNFLLILWSTFGVVLTELLLITTLPRTSKKIIMLAVLIFIFFSGIDVIYFGIKYIRESGIKTIAWMHMEWWSGWQFSSMTTCLFWVFNQAIPAWIATLITIQFKNFSSIVVLFVPLCFLSPFAAVGLFLLVVIWGIGQLIIRTMKEKKLALSWCRSLLSWQNCLILLLVPFILCYFMSNVAVGMGGSSGLLILPTSFDKFILFIIFYVLEAGIFALLMILGSTKRLSLILPCLFVLLLCPFLHIGTASDFCMRASIPPLVIICVLVIEALLTYKWDTVARKIAIVGLCTCLLLGACTPMFEIARGFRSIILYGYQTRIADNLISYDGVDPEDARNVKAVVDESFFFQNIAKRHTV